MRKTSVLLLLAMIGAGGLLAACDKTPPDSAGASMTVDAARTVEAHAKYNAYVDAANRIGDHYEAALRSYRNYTLPQLKGAGPLEHYNVVDDQTIDRDLKGLQTAIASPGEPSDIDPAAQELLQAVQALGLISRELSTYASSKGYLADQGAKARANNDAYLAALEKAAKAEENLADTLERHDREMIESEFGKATKGSANYYRLGILLHAKNGLVAMQAVANDKDNPQKRKAVESEFDQLQALLDERKGKLTPGCTSVNDYATGYLAAGRSLLQNLDSGTKGQNALSSRLEYDYRSFSQQFNNLIGTFNQPGQC